MGAVAHGFVGRPIPSFVIENGADPGNFGELWRIGEELIIVEPAELCTELHIEVAFGKRGMYRHSRGLWH